jgi:asparagine synthase (glutamine-hydrolysing)
MNSDAELRSSLQSATESLSHRGPDDSGLFFDDTSAVGLGHRRLSIIDLSPAGHQPMENEDGQMVIAYNGEIYNFKAIKKDLETLGHRFKSATDTEVVLKAFMQWGPASLDKFVGMFAISIWDRSRRQLFLARDRLGIKPLFYHHKKGMFLFASEMKSLMAFNGFKKELHYDHLPLFLHYQYIPAPHTIFNNTHKLLPGHYLLYDGEKVTTKAYWHLPGNKVAGTPSPQGEQAYLDHLDDVLTQAVSDRLISDVPLGALLSGGIDSSLVVALMQKVAPEPIRTFSIGFQEDRYNEAPWAARIAQHLGTDHTELYVTPDEALEVIPRLPEIYDEPFADSSAIPTSIVSRLTRSHVTVALSGDGGDEQFAGYVRYWMTRSMASGLGVLPYPVKKVLVTLLSTIPPRWIEKGYLPLQEALPQRFRVTNFQDKWQKLIAQLGHDALSELYRLTICVWPLPDVDRLVGCYPMRSRYEQIFQDTVDLPTLTRLMLVDQNTYLPDAMLTKVDRASMACGLEVRVPLLDHRVVEYSASIPEHLKYHNGCGKYILQRLLSRYLPGALYRRPKMGFGVPIEQWLRHQLKDLMLDYLSYERLKKEGLLKPEFVEQKMDEHLNAKSNHQHRIWTLLMWEMWREKWL